MTRARSCLAAIAAAIAALLGCSGLGSVECYSNPPTSIAFDGPVDESATAGIAYRQPISATAGSLLGPSHGIVPVDVPPGATVNGYGVTWTPPVTLAGTTQRFRLRSDTDFCGRSAELSWAVRVSPPIEITRFDAVPAVVSIRGTPVQLHAEYSGGTGQLVAPFSAPLASGGSLDVGAVSATATYRLALTSPAGDVVERSVTVIAQEPPAITATWTNPSRALAGETLALSWTVAGTVTRSTLDPGAIDLGPSARGYDVVATLGVSYTLTVRNDVGDVATATIVPVVEPRATIESVSASPAHPAYLGTTDVTAVFSGGTGLLSSRDLSVGPIPITSGAPVALGPLDHNVELLLSVTSDLDFAYDELALALQGPETWELVPAGPGEGIHDHTATLLQDGTVLLAGGKDAAGLPAGTTIWDPVTHASRSGPALLHARSGHAAALLRDGRVLLAGGVDPAGPRVDEAEVLDVAAGISAPAGAVSDAWWIPQLVALPDGSAILHSASIYHAATILRFEPTTATLSSLVQVGNLGWVRPYALPGGGVLLLSGGYYGTTPSMILDPVTGALSPTGATLRDLGVFEGVELADGRILLMAGEAPAEIFDSGTGTFSWTGAPTTSPLGRPGALLATGEVVVSGAASMRYDPVAGTFRETGGMFADYGGAQPLVVLPDGGVVATGGRPQRYRP